MPLPGIYWETHNQVPLSCIYWETYKISCLYPVFTGKHIKSAASILYLLGNIHNQVPLSGIYLGTYKSRASILYLLGKHTQSGASILYLLGNIHNPVQNLCHSEIPDVDTCPQGLCAHGCTMIRGEPVCDCRPGYKLHIDDRTCQGKSLQKKTTS